MTTRERLAAALQRRILVLDGAMGTMLQQQDLTEEDFGGPETDGCNEVLNLTRPEVIEAIHTAYLEAGADIIETNTFGATPIVLAEYGLADRALEINVAAARIAVRAVQQFEATGRERFVAGSMGPTTKNLSVTGGVTFDELANAYELQARGLIEGGVDLLLLETAQDLLNVKAAGLGIERARVLTGVDVPVFISGTIEPMGTTLAGQTIDAFYVAVEHLKPLAVGLNCATGPEFMRDHLRALSTLATCAVSCYPNAGLPDEDGHYHETPSSLSVKLGAFADQGWLNVVGGCCGTTPDHIRALAAAVRDKAPRQATGEHAHMVSGLESLLLEADNRPLLVGERTNVIGSRKFRRLIADEDYDAAAEVARDQVRAGAHVIDICLADPDRDEVADMAAFLPRVVRRVKVPLMIDSTDARVVELGLKHAQGKSIINSANLEDGEHRLREFAALATRYGSALVIGTIDEQGMAVTRQRKLDVAVRTVGILTKECGMKPQDIIIDPLTFPAGTGDEAYLGAALETVEGIRLIKQHLPLCPTILGVSNVSFGLPPSGREVLNSVFLYNCTKAGLDYAIVNSEKLERFASIADSERQLAEELLFHTTDALVAEFTAFYRGKKPESTSALTESLPVEERLARRIVDGSKTSLTEDLDEMLTKAKPLDIINGPLMDGMSEVGRLFNNNELIVAEVLQSAEVMKAAVAYLEPYMEKTQTATKGKLLLATVKGDVHDIGKNLVEIILTNNGYEVINLGIKVPPEQLIEAVRRHQPDLIGLSGLLVKSAQQMVTTADDLRAAGVSLPLLVGGAALTKRFTLTRIAPQYGGPVLYAKDAMDGLDLANRLTTPSSRQDVLVALAKEQSEAMASTAAGSDKTIGQAGPAKRSDVRRDVPVYLPPDLDRHVLSPYPLTHVRPYLNLQMLLGKHLGLRGNVDKLLASGDERALELLALVDSLLTDGAREGWLSVHGMYRFFPAQAVGDKLLVHDPDKPDQVAATFEFPRQRVRPYLCLADFVREAQSGVMDYVAMLTVTAGRGVRERAEAWKEAGDYLRAFALQALALELAEAFAERVHHLIRDAWGFPDKLDMTMRERFMARYQGIRVSFGYPACPNLEDQEKLFALLRPQDIGVELTDGFMMEPEASVSALVFSHPDARYFNADASERESVAQSPETEEVVEG
ncbi:methionine synthase [Alicyclobacillus sp. ALC3]|uniref:methionine synthase n=1 Tax=Alicyclobacillus sp. ALC3 TaxID=2796143 RepID=UPI002377E403|nr:methionine synthase [Alicyclobacillus sp. ALC3]WDL97288.1 methionine synthase [Alicyclobacillus sp. ALC3]